MRSNLAIVLYAAALFGCASVDLPRTDHTFNDRASYTYDLADAQLQVTVVCRYREPIYGMQLSGASSSIDRCAGYARKIAEKIASTGSFKLAVPYVPHFKNWTDNPSYSGFNTRENGETVSVITLTLPIET